MNQVEQRRAAKGGEVGANGEWYKGGAFIATRDNPKGEAKERQPANAAWSDEWVRRQEAVKQWLEPRLERFAALIGALDAQGLSFMGDMGMLLRSQGYLSPRQAECVVKFWLGRRVKRNADQWDSLMDDLCEKFQR